MLGCDAGPIDWDQLLGRPGPEEKAKKKKKKKQPPPQQPQQHEKKTGGDSSRPSSRLPFTDQPGPAARLSAHTLEGLPSPPPPRRPRGPSSSSGSSPAKRKRKRGSSVSLGSFSQWLQLRAVGRDWQTNAEYNQKVNYKIQFHREEIERHKSQIETLEAERSKVASRLVQVSQHNRQALDSIDPDGSDLGSSDSSALHRDRR